MRYEHVRVSSVTQQRRVPCQRGRGPQAARVRGRTLGAPTAACSSAFTSRWALPAGDRLSDELQTTLHT
jgi:hypothetical protein